MPSIRNLLWILITTSLIVFVGVTSRPLLKSSEGRVARVAQEMLEDGDWIVPHLNGAVRLEKPPFSSWLVALTSKFSGALRVEAWHAYVPPGGAAIMLVLLIYCWTSNKAFTSEHLTQPIGSSLSKGMLAALVLVTAPGFLLQAHSAEMDMLLALWVTVSFWGFWKFRMEGCVAALLVAYGALGLAILTKAHTGIVLCVPALLFWHWTERQRMALPLLVRALPKRQPQLKMSCCLDFSAVAFNMRGPMTRAGTMKWHLLGLLLVGVIVLPWAIPFIERSGITWQDFNREGGSGRFSSETGHQESWYWYIYQVPGWFLPWILLFPLALWQTRMLPPDEHSPLRRLCWCWFGWGMLLFSAVSSKQRHYSIIFFPPMAILIADAIERWAGHFEPGIRKFAKGCLALFSGTLAFSALVLPWLVCRGGGVYALLPGENVAIAWVMAMLAAVAFSLSALAIQRRQCCVMSWWTGFLCVVMVFTVTREYCESHESGLERFAHHVRTEVPQDSQLYDYSVAYANNTWRAQVLFYLQRKLTRTDCTLTELIQEKGRNVFALATENAIKNVPVELYEVLLNEHKFLGHKNQIFLLRGK